MSRTASVTSMTGFSSVEGLVRGKKVRLELKALNHRTLDLKVRLPRELSAHELSLRSLIQSRFSRGSIEAKLELLADPVATEPPAQANVSLAAHYYESILAMQRTLGLTDPIRTVDLLALPDVITRSADPGSEQDAWPDLENLAGAAIQKLTEMRSHEGSHLAGILMGALKEMEGTLEFLRRRREDCQEESKKRLQDKIKAVFEAYPIHGAVQPVLESRISQELAILLDRTDVEEELVRFHGHLEHFRKTLSAGGAVGRKLDFILQEMNREVNTLGNKAQDLAISEEIVGLKVRLEQLREQVMNIE